VHGLRKPSSETRRIKEMLQKLAAVLSCLSLPLGAGFLAPSASASSRSSAKPTIVLVHGAWADGSSWSRVLAKLQQAGYAVDVPPDPLRGPTEDSAYLASYLSAISGPIVLVGHSYGGFVITNAATGNPQVKALVYVDAFIPAAGQTLLQLTTGSCLSGDPSNIFNAVPFVGGVDLYIKAAATSSFSGFDQCFANGVPRREAAALAATQRPIELSALSEPSGPPAWASIPSWSVIGTRDHVIPPAQQEVMSRQAHARVTMVPAGHLSLITQAGAITKVIDKAASSS